MTTQDLLSRLKGVKRNGYLAPRAAHDDHNPSVSVRDGDEPLRERHVVILPDIDEAGRKHAQPMGYHICSGEHPAKQ